MNGFYSFGFTKENFDTLPEVTDKEVRSEHDNIIISESKVLKLLKELNASKAMSPDNRNPFVIKKYS